MRKKIFILALVFLIVIAAAGWVYQTQRPFDFTDRQSLSDVVSPEGAVTPDGEQNIRKLLQSKITETDDRIGFAGDSFGADLYQLNSYVQYCAVFRDEKCLNDLKQKVGSSVLPSPDSLSILNLLYYVNICDTLSLDYSTESVTDRLKDFYDQELHLFYLTDQNNTLHQKITLTAMCVRQIPALRTDPAFSVTEGAKQAYESYQFETTQEQTFYNSGGDILYLYDRLGLIDSSITDAQTAWFQYWEQVFRATEIRSIADALAWAEYSRIARLFTKDDGHSRLQSYYDRLTAADAEAWNREQADFLMISTAFDSVDTKANQDVSQYLSQTVRQQIQGELFAQSEIDIQNTAYGLLLKKMANDDIDRDKLQNLITETYRSIASKETISEKINALYYTVIADGLNNGYRYSCDSRFYQSVIDETLKSIDYEKDAYSAVINARKAVELITDLQIHNVGVKLSRRQRTNIKKGMSRLLKKKEITESVCITDLYLLDSMLRTNLVSKETVLSSYRLLEQNGGARTLCTEGAEPDLYSTFRFYVCFLKMNDYSQLSAQQAFARSLQDGEALYQASMHDAATLESVYFGNCIALTAAGGDKS